MSAVAAEGKEFKTRTPGRLCVGTPVARAGRSACGGVEYLLDEIEGCGHKNAQLPGPPPPGGGAPQLGKG